MVTRRELFTLAGAGALAGPLRAVQAGPSVRYRDYSRCLPDYLRAQAERAYRRRSALALYIYSLQPPRNPNLFDEKAKVGREIFAREGCPVCHTPPLYTNNKITLARGFDPPKEALATLDILLISVGTDPGLALRTR